MNKLLLVAAIFVTLFSLVHVGGCVGSDGSDTTETTLPALPTSSGVPTTPAESSLPSLSWSCYNALSTNYSLMVQCVDATGKPIVDTRIRVNFWLGEHIVLHYTTDSDGKLFLDDMCADYFVFTTITGAQSVLGGSVIITSEIIDKGELVVVFDI